jgi:hypothetical protein
MAANKKGGSLDRGWSSFALAAACAWDDPGRRADRGRGGYRFRRAASEELGTPWRPRNRGHRVYGRGRLRTVMM